MKTPRARRGRTTLSRGSQQDLNSSARRGAGQRKAPNAAGTLGGFMASLRARISVSPTTLKVYGEKFMGGSEMMARTIVPAPIMAFAAPERPVGAGGRTPVAAEPEVGCSRGPKQSGRENA